MESRKNEYTLKSISNQVEQTWGKNHCFKNMDKTDNPSSDY